MDFRIRAKSPVYGTRAASRVTDSSLKTSFAMMMAKEKQSISQGSAAKAEKAAPAGQDTVEISGNSLSERLENVHQKIDEIDFTGKNRYEKYKLIYDAYEEEFGFPDFLFYIDEDTWSIIDQDKQTMLANAIPGYSPKDGRLHHHAMGYDKMSKEEAIAAIGERIGGNTYVHKICMLNELRRADIITGAQQINISGAMRRQAGKEYCAKMGFDYIKWSSDPEQYYANPYGDGIPRWDINFMAWAAETETTWLKVIESIQDYEPMYEWQREELLKELEGTSELLIRSDNA